MESREEQLKRIAEESRERMSARVSSLGSTRVLSKDEWKERVDAVTDAQVQSRLQPTITTSRDTPSFTDQRSQQLAGARRAAGAPETLAPKVQFGLGSPDRTIAQKVLSLPRPKVEEAKRDFLGSFLAGSGIKPQKDTFGDTKAAGTLGFLYGTVLKSDEQRYAERYDKLVGQGVEPDRAFKIASNWESGVLPLDVTADESRSMKWFTAVENTFIALELADLLLIGKPVNAAVKGLARGQQVEFFARVAEAPSAAAARKIVTAEFPDIAGTEGVEELIAIARQTGERSSWRELLRNTATARSITEEGVGSTPVRTATDAQRIFYQDGIPVLRGAEDTGAKELVGLRDEIRSVLRGGREESRLSKPDILGSEIDAGSLPFKATPDDAVEVFFRADRAGGVGTRVSLSRELAETLGEGSTKSFKANVDDLVRLDDGTFVYAPKKQLSANLEPQITQIRAAQRQRVKEAEDARVEAIRMNRQIEIEQAKAEAAVKAKARQEQARAVAKAKEVLESNKSLTTERISSIRSNAQKEITAIREKTKAASKETTAARQSVDKLVTQVGKKSGEIAKKRAQYRRKLDAVKNRSRMTGAEREKLRASLRKERDKVIAEIEKKYTKLGKDLERARTKLRAAEEKLSALPDKDATIAAIKADSTQAVEDLTTASKTELAEAQRIIDEGGELGEAAKVELKKPAVVRVGEEVAERIDASEVYTTEFTGSLFDAATGAIKPIDSEGKKAISKISSRILKEGEDALRRSGLTAKQAHLLPQEYRVATNKEQIEKAVERVYRNPEKAYQDYMNIPAGSLEDTSNAALALALRQHDYVRSNLSRARLVEQRFASEGTRIAQEMQARVMLGSQEKGAILSRLFAKTDTLLKSRVKNVDAEIAKLKKELGEEWENLATASKDDVVDYINTNLCT